MTEIISKELLVNEAAYLSKEHDDVMAIMCCGSQNYGLDIDSSDFDTKAIIVPTFEDLVRGTQVSKTIAFDCGLCDVKDVRIYIENLKKQNVNYVETLFTEHRIINPRYRSEFEQLLEKKEEIAVIDKERSLKAMCGMLDQAKEKLKKSCEARDVTAANKSYVNIFKCALMADKCIKGCSYKEVLDCSKIRTLRDKDIPLSQMLSHAEHLSEKTEKAIDQWLLFDALDADAHTERWLDAWVVELIRSACLATDSSAAEEPQPPIENAAASSDTQKRIERKTFFSRVKDSVGRSQP